MIICSFSIPSYFFTFHNFVYCHSFAESKKALQFHQNCDKMYIIKQKVIKDLGLLPIIHLTDVDIKTEVSTS